MISIINANIFGKNLFEVSTDDVRAFCSKGIKEGINLDYKKDFSSPGKIAKTIASMANTLGGWILIGVEDDGNDKPVLPVVGLDNEDQLALRVTNLVIDHISPPALPVVHVCEPDADGKTFVVLYVAESPEAPHWLFNENKLCVRREDRTSSTKWDNLASANEWEYLRDKRKKSVQMYDDQKDILDSLFSAYDDRSYYALQNTRTSGISHVFVPRNVHGSETEKKLNIVISPKYPHTILFNVESGLEIVNDLRFHDTYGTGDNFPMNSNEFNVFQNGVHMYLSDEDREHIHFFALNQYGMIAFKEKVLENGRDNQTIVRLESLLVKLKQNLIFARKLYARLNYQGIITIQALLDGEPWMELAMNERGNIHQDLKSPISQITFTQDATLADLSDDTQLDKIIETFFVGIANAFRWDPMSRRDFKSFLTPFGL